MWETLRTECLLNYKGLQLSLYLFISIEGHYNLVQLNKSSHKNFVSQSLEIIEKFLSLTNIKLS